MRRALSAALSSLLFVIITACGAAVANAQQPTLKLPFPGAYQSNVLQAAHGSFSHRANNTQYDIDLNTANAPNDEVVLASAEGTVYVIYDAHPGQMAGFGNHVNIDHGPVDRNNPAGDHYFSVYCHLKTFLVSNGQFVRQGQPIGMEGCTGYCDGDHVHFGLHVGDPRVNVGSSRSVRAEHVITRDVTSNPGGPFVMLNTEQFEVGHYYESNNAYPSFCTNTMTWNFTQDSQCWAFGLVSGATTIGFNAPGAWIIKIGKDPHVESPPLNIDAAGVRTVEVHMASQAADTTVQVFFKTDGSNSYSESKSKTVRVTNDGSYATYLFDFAGHPDWKGRITGIRVDPATNGNGEAVGIKWVSVTPNIVINPDPTGSITVNATLNGQAWSGPVNYRVVGPNRVIIGSAVPGTTNNLPLGQYTLSYESGGPDSLVSITPSATRTLAADAAMTFTMNFGGQGGGFDEFGPNLNITSHYDGQTVSASSVIISGTASDAGRGDSGIASVTVSGVRASGDTASGPDTALWSRAVALSPGVNTITVVATDNNSPPNQTPQTITLNLSGGGSGGGVTTIAAGLSNPNSIATDGTEVFWTDYGSNSVKKVSVNGGPVTILVGAMSSPSGIGVDSGHVYFGSDFGLKKVPKGGGSAVTLAGGLVTRLVVDGAHVYWTNYSAGTVQKVSVNGGAVTTLASGLTSPMGITLAGSNVCWSEFNNPGAIRCVGVNGGQVSVLGNNSNAPGIAADAANVYWAENVFINSGKVNKVPASGGTPVSLATGLNSPWDVALDGASAFWAENSTSGAVKQVSLGGGTPVVLAGGLAEPVGVAVDSAFVYWIERAGGAQGTGVLKKVGKGTAGGGPGFVPLNFSWQFKSSMPQGRSGSAVAVYNNQIYVVGGDFRLSHYRYDPATNSWSTLAPVPGNGIYEGGAAAVSNKIYAIGNSFDTLMRIYDTASNSWSTGAPMPAQTVRGPSVVEHGGKVYVIGGADASLNASNAVRVYDPGTDSWTVRASMPTARSFATAAVVNNLIYVIGGLGNTQPQIQNAVEVYDPASDTWTTRNTAPVRSYIAAHTALGGRIYLLGGGDGTAPLSTVNEYDPASDTWRSLSRIQVPRYMAVAGAVNNRIYIMGGGDAGSGLSSIEEGVPTGAAPTLSLSPDPLNMFANQFSPLTFTISAAQNSDVVLSITSSDDTVASVASSLTIPAGSTSASTLVFGKAAGGPVTIRASLPPSLANMSDDAAVTVVGRKPDVTTGDAEAVTATGAVLAGAVSPNGLATNAWFEYGTDSTFSTFFSTPPQLVRADAGPLNIRESLGGLPSGAVHFFRAAGSNNAGTVRGAVKSFSTASAALRIDAVTPRAGRASGAQQIKLTGSFGGLATVSVGGAAASWSFTNGAGEITVTTPPHAVGAVGIEITATSGATHSRSNAFAYLPTVFTDDPLVAGVTQAKAQHVSELRQAVEALRAVAGLPQPQWTEPVPVNFVTRVKAVHIAELRTNLEDAAVALGYSVFTYTDSPLGGGSVIRRVHIEELRLRIKALAGECPGCLL